MWYSDEFIVKIGWNLHLGDKKGMKLKKPIQKLCEEIAEALKKVPEHVEVEVGVQWEPIPKPIVTLYASARAYSKRKRWKCRMKTEKKAINAFIIMTRALANETRLNLLYSLYKKPKTWTELIFEFQINPKSLRDHLDFLIKSGLVKKRAGAVGFELTEPAKQFIETSLKDLISTAKEAVSAAKK